MSGSGNQPNSGGGQPSQQGGQPQQTQGGQPQGGQPQGGQPQGGQPQQGNYGQPPQGGGGESALAAVQRPGPMSYVKGTAILGAIGGAVFGLMMVLIGKVGGFPILPSAYEQARQLASGAGSLQGTAPGTGVAGASPTAMLDAGVSTSHEVIIAYMSTELAPFIAFGLAVVVGVLIATQMDDTDQAKLSAAAVGTFAAGLLLVVVSSVIIGFLGPSVPDVLMSQAGTGASFVDPGLASPQFGNIAVNGLIAGVGGAVAAAGTVFSLNNFVAQ